MLEEVGGSWRPQQWGMSLNRGVTFLRGTIRAPGHRDERRWAGGHLLGFRVHTQGPLFPKVSGNPDAGAGIPTGLLPRKSPLLCPLPATTHGPFSPMTPALGKLRLRKHLHQGQIFGPHPEILGSQDSPPSMADPWGPFHCGGPLSLLKVNCTQL